MHLPETKSTTHHTLLQRPSLHTTGADTHRSVEFLHMEPQQHSSENLRRQTHVQTVILRMLPKNAHLEDPNRPHLHAIWYTEKRGGGNDYYHHHSALKYGDAR